MIRRQILSFAIASTFLTGAAQAQDVAGSKDHPQVGRYAGAKIESYIANDFDEVRLIKKALPADGLRHTFSDDDSLRLEGKVMRIRYDAPVGRSTLEILRNYQQSLQQKGFETIFTCSNKECIGSEGGSYFIFGALADKEVEHYRYEHSVRYLLVKRASDQGDTYASILIGDKNGEPSVYVTAVDVKPMQDGQIKFIDANAMEKAIAATGRVALYGIEFDTDKADIRPSSQPTLDEMAKFLKSTQINVIIAGHTDNQGEFAYNVGLSQRRAAAVVSAMQTRGIAAGRMTAFGNGMAAPLADNVSDAGRQKNRRVEMVRR